nr:MAG TPA: hypothetical protein [Caudoviricetes sp.]
MVAFISPPGICYINILKSPFGLISIFCIKVFKAPPYFRRLQYTMLSL